MTIRTMTLPDLQTVLGWAAEEGWNPGLEDAQAFYAADPEGFFIKEVAGRPIAAISVVNHDPDFAFLGLYLCRPQYRGQGHGIDIWTAGLAHAGGRNIGLDGVPDQEPNYARSGFVKHGSTVRYEGLLPNQPPDPRVQLASTAQTESLILSDMAAAGMQRRAFAQAWLCPAPGRQTVVLENGAEITGFATFRRCRNGVKVGGLQAASAEDAHALLASSPFAQPQGPLFVDVLGHDAPLAQLLRRLGFLPTFETARMYKGRAPQTQGAPFQAIATMELG